MTTKATTHQFTSTKGMPPTCKTALRNLLIALADTKLLLGYHYGEWTFGPPALEAAIACCSLGQAELGHVRLLHGILNTHFGDDPDALVESRKPEEFANIPYLDHELKDWSEIVAANYIVDLALTTLLNSLRESSFQPLHMSLDKMIQEETYHIHHGQGWFRTLAQKSDATIKQLKNSAEKALTTVVEWFGPDDSEEDTILVETGIKSDSNAAILQNFLREVGVLSESLKLELGLTKANGKVWQFKNPPQWKNWNPQTRRIQKTGPDEQILYHLRGSKNKVFKLS
jgi:ring-1,2-phenylacetyl-CoA epoxidase subunit PaaC